MFKTIKPYFYSSKSSKYLHCLWISSTSSHTNDPTIKNCLLGAVTLTKNADIEKYKYSGYGTGLIEDQVFHFQVEDLVKCINFWRRYQFFYSYDNKKKDILVLRRVTTQGLESTLTAEKMYYFNKKIY